nr:transglycosylase SLT domain-containing protein [uncultured Arsenicibacter sp.]
MALPYENYVPANYKGVTRAAFVAKVRNVASRLGIAPEWLMVVMYKESRLEPWAKNPKSTASGLIQWLESTAQKQHGVTTAQIRAMDGLKQMDLVYDYYKPYKAKLKSLTDTYLAVHYPKGMAKDSTYVLYRSGSDAYSANRALDKNNDGAVTVSDVAQWLGNQEYDVTLPVEQDQTTLDYGSTILAVLAFTLLGVAAYYAFDGKWGQMWGYVKLRTKKLAFWK